jgi:hypothetical protein
MATRQKLYVCGPCAKQVFHDVPVRGPLPVYACEGCTRPMTATFPSLARRIIEKARETNNPVETGAL